MTTRQQLPTEAELEGYVQTLTNWGRWGSSDELGTVNLITPAKRQQAATLVQDGTAVSCARTIGFRPAPDVPVPPQHYMTGSGETFLDPERADSKDLQGSADYIGMVFHGFYITHLDSLCHVFWKGRMYNDKPASLVTTSQGALAESIELLGNGVVSRGVLLDIARHRGVDWMQPGDGVLPDELEEAAAAQGVQVDDGDILLVRTGHYKRRAEEGPRPISEGWPGLHAACLPWLRERGAALLGGDTVNDVVPSGYEIWQPIHQIGMPTLGLWLLDNCDLEVLAAACEQRGRWEFMLTIAPLRIRHGTGSPVNPIAVF